MLILWLALIIPQSGIYVDQVEAIEINAVYDETGNHLFDQLIFRDDGKIVAWRLWRRRKPSKPEQAKFEDRWKRINWRDRTPHRAGSTLDLHHTALAGYGSSCSTMTGNCGG